MWDNCWPFSAVHRNVIKKRQVLRNMEPSESRKGTVLENLQNSQEFPPGISGTVDSWEFLGIFIWEFLIAMHYKSQGLNTCNTCCTLYLLFRKSQSYFAHCSVLGPMCPYKPVYEPCTGHTGHTDRILYTWPYYTPSKGPSNCPKC